MSNQNPLLDFLLRRYRLLLLVVCAAGGGAFVYAQAFAAQTWTFGTTLLYNRTSLGAPHYQQPEVQTIVGLFKSRTVLDRLVNELKLPPVIKPLADSISAEQQLGANVVQVTLKTDRPDRASQILDQLTSIASEQIIDLRRTTAERLLKNRRRQLDDARRTAESAAANLQAFYSRNGIVTTLQDELQQLRGDILDAERALETDRPTTLQPTDDLQRQRDLLHAQLLDEREKIDRESALAVKKQDYDRAVRLHDKRYISDTEFRRVEAEYHSLQAQSAAALRARQEQIDRLDQRLAEKIARAETSSATGASPNAIDAATTARVQAFLAQRRAEAERLNGLRTEADDLQRGVAAAHAEVERQLALIAGGEELRDSDFRDLTVLQPPAPALDPTTSNKKKLLVGAFAGLLIAGCLPILVFDLWSSMRRRKSESSTSPTIDQLPTWTASTAERIDDHKEAIRAFALRLQQIPSASGAVVSLHNCSADDAATELATATAECLHRRGERVLIVSLSKQSAANRLLDEGEHASRPVGPAADALDDWLSPRSFGFAGSRVDDSNAATSTLAPQAVAGLAELLADPEARWSDAVRRSESFDVLPFGTAALPEEAFASRRLTHLLDEFRRRYGVVLLVGPDVEHRVDLELLAARVDGLAFVARGGATVSTDSERLVAHLAALRAPVLGTVRI